MEDGAGNINKQVVQLAEKLLDGGFDKISERRVLTHIASRLDVTCNVNHAIEEEQTPPDRLMRRGRRQ
jgi:hypothetical protein